MQKPELYARLDKSGKRVLCKVQACGGIIAEIAMNSTSNYPPVRILNLPPGLAKGPAGVWRLTPYARDRMKMGKAPKPRRRPAGSKGPGTGVALNPPLPCFAECPKCHRPHVLDPAKLNAEAEPMTHADMMGHGGRFAKSLQGSEDLVVGRGAYHFEP